ncbi:GNAT family N-acetyltransferase [Dyella koreensis]|uniref:GNAT family N-acetyltransferase n=1 Tax=Dyella koreensis TaxID=311235 RepID=A0ABW8K9G5_9GAMM
MALDAPDNKGAQSMTQTTHRSISLPARPPSLQERLRDGSVVYIRPILHTDASLEKSFLSRLTPEGLSYRFLGLVKDSSPETARELTHIDASREFALAALSIDGDQEKEIGVACYRLSDDGRRCDCAVTVDPTWQNRGVGRALMQHLIGVARAQGVQRMYAVDAVRCAGAHALAQYLGFHSRPDPEDPAVVTFELELD